MLLDAFLLTGSRDENINLWDVRVPGGRVGLMSAAWDEPVPCIGPTFAVQVRYPLAVHIT